VLAASRSRRAHRRKPRTARRSVGRRRLRGRRDGGAGGHALAEYIHNPAGGHGNTFAFLPGDFEVPSGAFSYGDSIYLFYTTVAGNGSIDMQGSYLARCSSRRRVAHRGYQILYAVDERFDASGRSAQLRQHRREVAGDYVYLFGTGKYRASAIHVARKRLDSLATPGRLRGSRTIVTTPGLRRDVGALLPGDRALDAAREESLPDVEPASSRTSRRSPADRGAPPSRYADMGDPSFRQKYCCTTDDAVRRAQMFNCDRTGFYGSYLFPSVQYAAADHTFTATYTLSSFSPYNVALFQTTFTE